MKLLFLPLLISLCGCAVITQQKYEEALAKCGTINIKGLAESEKTNAEKQLEFESQSQCILNANQTYYPQYAHLWQEHLAENNLTFSQVLEGKLTPEEAKLLFAKSYSNLNQQASAIEFQNQQLQTQQNAQLQQYLLGQQMLQNQQQQQLMSLAPKRQHCTYDFNRFSNSIDSTCW